MNKNRQEPLSLFAQIKSDLQKQITQLQNLKAQMATFTADAKLKSKVRIQIETYLIEINEEIFAISDELAKSFAANE